MERSGLRSRQAQIGENCEYCSLVSLKRCVL
ncbi:hypothetical protein WG66_013127 [Moniliophthora roreri]|nr:hypothetical protein WG66_013127 [Moniliophthora roreri]